MDGNLLWIVAVAGWLVTAVSAIAHQVIHEVSWHELEEYCQQQRSDRFGQIFDLRDRISLGTLLLCMISSGIAVSCACYLLFFAKAELTASSFWSSVVLVCIGLVFAGSLIPWAVSQVWAHHDPFPTANI